MANRRIETMVGTFVLLGLVAVLFLALKSANLGSFSNAGSGYALTARFDNIGGLKARAPVRSAGVTVGRVTSITLDNKTFQGIVTLNIDQHFQFPKDSAAKILTSGLLGDQYVGIEPGGDEKNLAAGDTVAQTQSAVVLENLIGQFLTGKASDAADQSAAPASSASASASASAAAASTAVGLK